MILHSINPYFHGGTGHFDQTDGETESRNGFRRIRCNGRSIQHGSYQLTVN